MEEKELVREKVDNKQSDKIFIKKLQDLINLLDEIDNEIKDRPTDQSKVDGELQDWYHLMQNEDLSDEQYIKIGKQIKELRKERNALRKTSLLHSYYETHKYSLIDNKDSQRDIFVSNMMLHWKTSDKPYKPRVLDEDTVNEILSEDLSKGSKEEKNNKSSKKKLNEVVIDNGKKVSITVKNKDKKRYSYTEIKEAIKRYGGVSQVADNLDINKSTLSMFMVKMRKLERKGLI